MRRCFIPVFVLFLLTAFGPGTCRADVSVPGDASLTVEQAIDLALANRNDVRSASLDLDAASVSNDLAWDYASGVMEATQIPGTNQYVSVGSDPFLPVYNSDFALKAKQKAYDIKRQSVEFSVYQRYYAVVNALDKFDAQQLAGQQATENLKIAALRNQLGMDTNLALYKAQSQATAAQGSLATAQQELDQKYITLLEYIGMPKTSRPALVRELTFVAVDIADPEAKFSAIVNDSPSVWIAKQSVQLTEETAGNANSDELDAINLEKADINVLTTRESMLQATRNIYYGLKSIEDSYPTAQASVRTTQEALRVAKLMLDLGMGTKTDVLNAEIAANNATQMLDSLSYQHAILKMAFEKPWAYGSAN